MTDRVLYSNTSEVHNQAKIFCEIGRVLTSSLNPKEVFNRVMKLIGEHFSPRNWSLLLMDEKTERLKFEIVMGVDATKLKNFYIEKGEGISGWVCQNGHPAVVEDVRGDPRFSSRVDELLGFTTRSVVCVPLLNRKNRVVGAIELINRIVPPPEGADPESPPRYAGTEGEPFTVMDMEILYAIGAFTGIAAENAFLHQKVKELAMIDPLTGIYNRHYFNEVLKREQKKGDRFRHSICILMMDIDGLKAINDRYGHLTGDGVICDTAKILKSTVRQSDVLARYGGDEFVVLMPNTDEAMGEIIVDRINRLIQQENEKKQDAAPRLSLSIGVYASGSKDLNNILEQADRELYQTKYFRKNPDDLISEEQMRSYLWYNLDPNSE